MTRKVKIFLNVYLSMRHIENNMLLSEFLQGIFEYDIKVPIISLPFHIQKFSEYNEFTECYEYDI